MCEYCSQGEPLLEAPRDSPRTCSRAGRRTRCPRPPEPRAHPPRAAKDASPLEAKDSCPRSPFLQALPQPPREPRAALALGAWRGFYAERGWKDGSAAAPDGTCLLLHVPLHLDWFSFFTFKCKQTDKGKEKRKNPKLCANLAPLLLGVQNGAKLARDWSAEDGRKRPGTRERRRPRPPRTEPHRPGRRPRPRAAAGAGPGRRRHRDRAGPRWLREGGGGQQTAIAARAAAGPVQTRRWPAGRHPPRLRGSWRSRARRPPSACSPTAPAALPGCAPSLRLRLPLPEMTSKATANLNCACFLSLELSLPLPPPERSLIFL